MGFYTTASRVAVKELTITTIKSLSWAMIDDPFVVDAEAEINGRLARLYTVPVSNCPMLRTIATDFAIYQILRNAFSGERMKDSPWARSFLRSEKLLEGLADGSIPLVNSGGEIIESRSDYAQVIHNNQGYLPTMTEDDPSAQRVDPEKIDDIRLERNIF